jgi:copper chaperone CopZ
MTTENTDTRLYRVTGMTCQHCVNAVTDEVTALRPG